MGQQAQQQYSQAASQNQREADLLNAEQTERYRDIDQFADVMTNHMEHASQYLGYMFQDGAEPARLQSIAESIKQINGELDEIRGEVRVAEAQKLHQKREASRPMSDVLRYEAAVGVYEQGNIKLARAMFAALTRTAMDNTVKTYARQSFDMIIQYENDQVKK